MPKSKRKYIHREISWLRFNDRVLQEAADHRNPLFERIKFLGIFSSNLDEFFRVRVATLKRMVLAGRPAIELIGENPAVILNEVQKIVLGQQQRFNEIYGAILDELRDNRIFIINECESAPDQIAFVREYFTVRVRPALFPVMLGDKAPFPMLKDHAVYLAVRMRRAGNGGDVKYAVIEVPTDTVPRFLVLPRSGEDTHVMLLDDVIRAGLSEIFSMFDYEKFEAYTIKLTRDAELDIEDDVTTSFFEKVAKSLKKRETGIPVRFVYDKAIPGDFLEYLMKKLDLSFTDTVIPGTRYHNFKDFMNFPRLDKPGLRNEPLPPIPHPALAGQRSLLAVIRKQDILLHFPYQPYSHVIDLLREASIDPKVESIRISLYRVARNSGVVTALINAARNGKSVTVVMELQARFDEQANVYWTDRLREEGVRIIHGVPNLKVHCKICLIGRREKKSVTYYAMVATGNFNEDTAELYVDHGLLTADPRITREARNMFDFFDSNYKVENYRHLLVAPFHLRKKLIRLIKGEIKNARAGKEVWIILKLNHLYDKEMIDLLYRASREGVKISLIVRGICALTPGIRGVSDNITAISIVDRYLEHTRVYVFANGGAPKYYLSSADIMTRNLDHRVEAACPVYDPALQKELREFLDIQLADNMKARVFNEAQDNQYRKDGGPEVQAQLAFHGWLEERHS